MDKMKQWIALAAVGAVAILAGGWFLLVSPKRSDAASLRDQKTNVDQSNAILTTQLATLKAQQKDLPKQQAKLAAVAAKIPSNSAMPALVRAMTAAADEVGVELVSMAPGAPTPVTPPATTGTATAASTAAAGSAKAGAKPVSAAATAGAGSAAVGTLQQVPMNLQVVGSYFQVSEFLDRMENLTRAFRVTGFTLAPGSDPTKDADAQPSTDTGKQLAATISGLVFQTQGGTASSLTTAK